MNVEQTTQLIQLILNSLLMTVACSIVLGRAWVRYTDLEKRLYSLRSLYVERSGPTWVEQHLQVRKQVRHWLHRSLLSYASLLTAYYALLLAVASTFTLALRGLINFPWLIPASIVLFLLALGGLLLAIGLTLLDLHLSRRPLRQEVLTMVSGGSSLSSLPGQRPGQEQTPWRQADRRPLSPRRRAV